LATRLPTNAPEPSRTPLGVNVVGYFHAELGLGEAARLTLTALRAAGIPYVPIPDRSIATRQNAPFAEPAAPAQYAINLVCINPFELPAVAAEKGSPPSHSRLPPAR